jgi:hypothetical protein
MAQEGARVSNLIFKRGTNTNFDQDPLEVQQSVPSPQNNEGMLPSRLSLQHA